MTWQDGGEEWAVVLKLAILTSLQSSHSDLRRANLAPEEDRRRAQAGGVRFRSEPSLPAPQLRTRGGGQAVESGVVAGGIATAAAAATRRHPCGTSIVTQAGKSDAALDTRQLPTACAPGSGARPLRGEPRMQCAAAARSSNAAIRACGQVVYC